MYAEIARQTKARYAEESTEAGQAQLARDAEFGAQAASAFPGGSARREALIASLAVHGLRLRIDSHKCNAYIQHGVGNPDVIANVMLEMKWLFDNTDYAAQAKQVSQPTLSSIHFEDSMLHTQFATLQEKAKVHKDKMSWGLDDRDYNSDSSYPEVDWDKEYTAAVQRAKQQAVAAWYEHFGNDHTQVQDVPAGLLQLVPQTQV